MEAVEREMEAWRKAEESAPKKKKKVKCRFGKPAQPPIKLRKKRQARYVQFIVIIPSYWRAKFKKFCELRDIAMKDRIVELMKHDCRYGNKIRPGTSLRD